MESSSPIPDAGKGWISLVSAVELMSISRQAFHDVYRPIMKQQDVKTDDRGRVTIRMRGLVDAIVEKAIRRTADQFKKQEVKKGGDEVIAQKKEVVAYKLMRERYRKMIRDLISVHDVWDIVTAFSTNIRNVLENAVLNRLQPEDVSEQISSTLDQTCSAIERKIGAKKAKARKKRKAAAALTGTVMATGTDK